MNRLASQLFLVFFAFTPPTNAEEFITQKLLSVNYDRLQDWYISVVRIEITKGSTIGINAAPPKVKYKIIEVLRKGDTQPNKMEYICEWRNDSSITSWASHSLANPPDPDWNTNKYNWEMTKVFGPPANTRLIVFTGFNENSCHLYRDFSFADTPENRSIVLKHAASRPFMDRFEVACFWLTLISPAIGFFMLFFAPRMAIVISLLTFPAFIFYNSRMSVNSIRLDLIMAYPAMAFSALVILAGFALWVRNVANNEQIEKQAMKHKTGTPD